jgi:hypothetical protein
LYAGGASADPFSGTELLVGRSVKPSTGAERFTAGLTFQFAPMNVLLSSQKDTIVNAGIDAACNGDPVCTQAAKDNSDAALGIVGGLSDDEWSKIEAAAGDPAALDAELASAGVPEEQRKVVGDYAAAVPADKRKEALALSRQLAGQDVTSIAVEPSFALNFDLVSFTLRAPLALFMADGENSWNLGNVNLDTRFGHIWGDVAAFGISYGLTTYFPTGSQDANSMGMANMFDAPKYFREYLSAAPYLAMGFDVPILSLQWHGELVNQFGVRENPVYTHVMYGKYGAGFVLLSGWPVSIIGEVNGLAPLKNADGYNAVFGLGALQLKLLWLTAALGVQAPLLQPDKKDMGTIGGMDVGEMASYTIIGRAALVF